MYRTRHKSADKQKKCQAKIQVCIVTFAASSPQAKDLKNNPLGTTHVNNVYNFTYSMAFDYALQRQALALSKVHVIFQNCTVAPPLTIVRQLLIGAPPYFTVSISLKNSIFSTICSSRLSLRRTRFTVQIFRQNCFYVEPRSS